jgi:uncharacterized FlaG/YvyC family protein
MDMKIPSESSLRVPSVKTNDMKELLRFQEKIINLTEESVAPLAGLPGRTPKQTEFTQSTLSYATDSAANEMVLRIKDAEGNVKFQIPEEVRLQIAKQLRDAYAPKTNSIIDDKA